MERNSNPIIESDNISYYTYTDRQGVLVRDEVAEEYGIDMPKEYHDLDLCFIPFASMTDAMCDDIVSGKCRVESVASHEYCDIRGEGEKINTYECVNFSNPQRIEDRWEDEEFALNDESERMLLVKTTKYYDWTSARTRITDLICDVLERHEDSNKTHRDADLLNDQIADLENEWETAVLLWTANTRPTDWTVPNFKELVDDAKQMLGI